MMSSLGIITRSMKNNFVIFNGLTFFYSFSYEIFYFRKEVVKIVATAFWFSNIEFLTQN